VLAGLPAVAFTLPGWIGFFLVGVIGLFAMVSYLAGSKAVRAGKPVPPSLTQRATRSVASEVRRRRSAPPPSRKRTAAPLPPPRRPR
jgi:hypothetical protein